MNKYAVLQRLRGNLPRFFDRVTYSSMLDKMPTIDIPPEPLEIEDKPIITDPRQNESKAMKVYLENVTKYNQFMSEQRAEYEIGRRHLANMMGCDPETFAQKDIDRAIAYLFPCGLFEKKARPTMKPPEKIYPPRKEAEFDISGRPYHFLFYTNASNFYQILHDYVKLVKELDDFEDKVIRGEVPPPEDTKIMLEASRWIPKEALERICCERLNDSQYESFCHAMDRLAQHKYAEKAKSFIFKYRVSMQNKLSDHDSIAPVLLEDGRKRITIKENGKKSARATVTVTFPGTGKLDIEGRGLEFFSDIRAKEQILFPLALSRLLGKVDVEAVLTVSAGESGNAGAIRYGISRCLSYFVDADMKEKMRLAGLLQREVRRKERKKPGQEGARRQYTWRKR